MSKLETRQPGTTVGGAEKTMLDDVDARTKLVGSNRMEILLFSLGTGETFGINVFKVREVSKTPFITKAPNMPGGVEGLISLRGNVIPVLALAQVLGRPMPRRSRRVARSSSRPGPIFWTPT